MKVGFVSIVGRPNAGKSTLINSIIGSKVAIVSDKAHTTRNNIQGIYNDDDSQIIFIDTPGIHKPMHKLGKYMNSQSYYSIEDTNVILFMVDATEKIGKGDKFILEKLKEVDSNVFLVLNKVDRIKKENLFPMIEEYNKLFDFKEIIPISALKKDNIDDLIKTIKKYLDEGYKIVALTLSSDMSGTYQSACIAKDMLESDDIVVIDSRNVTSGLGVLVLKACEFRDNGDNIFEIEEKIKNLIPKVKSSLSFESLENLVRGGRLSKIYPKRTIEGCFFHII